MTDEITMDFEIPKHIAIIMDGNGRWATRRGKPRVFGHNAGMKALVEIVRACSDLGVKYLTVYAFSTENWKRPVDEVSGIFKIMVLYIQKELKELHRNNVRLKVLGNWTAIPEDAKKKMQEALDLTAENTGLQFNIALNYGGRREILDAVQAVCRDCMENNRPIEELDESAFSNYLSTCGVPDPDMIIRTGGEQRLSNFLLWQCAYSEFVFTDVFWPDFTREELISCMREFDRRNRRYGGI